VIEDYDEDDAQLAVVKDDEADHAEQERVARRSRLLASGRTTIAQPISDQRGDSRGRGDSRESETPAPISRVMEEEKSARAMEKVSEGKVFFEQTDLNVIKVCSSSLSIHYPCCV
jgi:hypothetical protein